MLFKDVSVNGLFMLDDEIYRKALDPQSLLFGGRCKDCGDETPWNARDLEHGCLIHFCPSEQVIPVSEFALKAP